MSSAGACRLASTPQSITSPDPHRALPKNIDAEKGLLSSALLSPKDVLQLWTQLVPFASKEVVWQGHRARIGKGTVLLEVERARLFEAA